MPRKTSLQQAQEDADRRTAVSERLDDATGRAAKILDVDPERIMYDVRAEQVCIPLALFEKLLDLAPRPITVPDDATHETAEYLGRLGTIAERIHEAARWIVVEGVNYASGTRPNRFSESARYVNMAVVNIASDAGLGILLTNAMYADQAAADQAPVDLASLPAGTEISYRVGGIALGTGDSVMAYAAGGTILPANLVEDIQVETAG